MLNSQQLMRLGSMQVAPTRAAASAFPQRRPRWTEILASLAGLYSAVSAGALLLRALGGERWLIVGMLNTGLHWLLLPALALLPVSLLLRRWPLALLNLPAVLTFVVGNAAFLTPTPPPPLETPRFSLLTYNLHAEQQALDPMVALIADAGADIVVLQELSARAAERFSADLAQTYPYRALHLPDPRWNGQAFFSRYPITEERAWPPPRRLLRVGLDVQGTPVVVYNAHPVSPFNTGLDTGQRSDEITFLLEQAAAETSLVVLAGDFNTDQWSQDYAALSARFSDAYAQAGVWPGFTYPDYTLPQSHVGARFPTFMPLLVRLDYVFHSAGLQAVEARVWPSSGGSDHRPVWVVLAVVAEDTG